MVSDIYLFVFLFGLIFLFSCEKVADKNKDILQQNYNQIDSLLIDENKEMSLLDSLFYKLNNEIILNKNEVDSLFFFISHDMFDEAQAESIGIHMYENLRPKRLNYQIMSNCLAELSFSERELLLKIFIQLMCIDIGEDKYVFDEFINDYPLFKGSKSAKEAFLNCIDNQVN